MVLVLMPLTWRSFSASLNAAVNLTAAQLADGAPQISSPPAAPAAAPAPSLAQAPSPALSPISAPSIAPMPAPMAARPPAAAATTNNGDNAAPAPLATVQSSANARQLATLASGAAALGALLLTL